MKSKLCSVLVVLFMAVLSATAAHADEPDAVVVEETVSESVSTSDALSAQREAEVLRYYSGIGAEPTKEEKGKRLMTAAFVAQGLSLSVTVASMFSVDVMLYSWVAHAITIPFAPMGVEGFALRYGSSSENERLHWAGIGLLEAAAFAAVIGGVTAAALLNCAGCGGGDGIGAAFGVPGMISHFGASIAFVIAGGVCVKVAKAQARRQEKSQSRRTPARPPHRGFVMPTIAPRPDGVSLGLTGVF